jgi:hypothetical protein
MESVKIIVTVAVLTLLTGCTAARTHVSSPMQSPGEKKPHYHNLVVLEAKSSLLHPTQSVSWMEDCKTKIESPVTQEEWDYPYRDCVRDDARMANVAGSAAQQVVTPVVSTAIGAAGFAAGMHQLGRGIAKSGSRTTNNNSTNSEGGEGGDASSRSSSAAKQNSDNVTKNHNNQTYNNNSKTNINSGNHFSGKH